MACRDMTTNACAAPRILNAEITMLARLSATLNNYWRSIVSLRHWLFGKKPEIEQAVVVQQCLVRDTNQVNDRPSASSGERASPAHAEFIRTQSQLMGNMLKAMILAAGESIDNGSTTRNRPKTRR